MMSYTILKLSDYYKMSMARAGVLKEGSNHGAQWPQDLVTIIFKKSFKWHKIYCDLTLFCWNKSKVSIIIVNLWIQNSLLCVYPVRTHVINLMSQFVSRFNADNVIFLTLILSSEQILNPICCWAQYLSCRYSYNNVWESSLVWDCQAWL